MLDVLPIDGSFLGFRSQWFNEAVETCDTCEIEPGLNIRVINPVYFVATKLEAFRDRGKQDFLASRDLEDILTVINGRMELVDEIRSSEGPVRKFLRSAFASLLGDPRFLESIPGHLNPEPQRTSIVIDRLRQMSQG